MKRIFFIIGIMFCVILINGCIDTYASDGPKENFFSTENLSKTNTTSLTDKNNYNATDIRFIESISKYRDIISSDKDILIHAAETNDKATWRSYSTNLSENTKKAREEISSLEINDKLTPIKSCFLSYLNFYGWGAENLYERIDAKWLETKEFHEYNFRDAFKEGDIYRDKAFESLNF